MGEVVNLRLRRKRKARTEKNRVAEQNRLLYGRTRAEREADRLGKALEAVRLDSHRLSSDDKET